MYFTPQAPQSRVTLTAVAALHSTGAMDVNSNSTLPLAPVAASSGHNTRGKWKTVKVEQGLVNILGGFGVGFHTAASIDFNVGDDAETHTYVLLDKNAQWFLKGAGGDKVQKGDVKAVKIIDTIRENFREACCTTDDVQCTTADDVQCLTADGVVDEGVVDPMDALSVRQVCAGPTSQRPRPDINGVNGSGTKGKRPRPDINKKKGDPSMTRSVMRQLVMPTRPECAASAMQAGDTTLISLWRGPGKAKTANNGKLYLRIDCLDWLLSYAADELHFQGIVPSMPDAPQSRLANCEEVSDLFVAWDFTAHAWNASFIDGPFKGTTKRVYYYDVTAALWVKLQQRVTDVSNFHGVRDGGWKPSRLWETVTFAYASNQQKKAAAKVLVIALCHAVTVGQDAVDEFEHLMRVTGTDEGCLLTPPPKKRKRTLGGAYDGGSTSMVSIDDVTAVADTQEDEDDDSDTE